MAQPGGEQPNDGRVDGAFHSPAFLAAHVATLQAVDRETFDAFKKRQDEAAQAAARVLQDEEQAQRDFRAVLDADRAKRTAAAQRAERKRVKRERKGGDKPEKHRKEHKKKHKKKRRSRSRSRSGGKRRRRGSSDSSSDSDSADKMRLSHWAAS